MFDPEEIRKDFPILSRKINGRRLVYLDNAATTQKPLQVISTLSDFYQKHNANIHRGIHTLAEEATQMYEEAREKMAAFLGSKSIREIIFVRNATEAINLVAFSWGRTFLKKGDEIILTETEHHSNLVPWQLLAREKSLKLKFIRIDSEGYLDLKHFQNLISSRTRLVSVTHVSNVLGTINPVSEIEKMTHKAGAKLLVDAAQSVPRIPIDVGKLNCDFLAISGHKMLGPTGIGVLFAKEALLDKMPPFLSGGDMIREVYFNHSEWNELPFKFEAGTANFGGAIALGVAVDYLSRLGMEKIFAHERKLTAYALSELRKLPRVKIYGPQKMKDKTGVVSFSVEKIHPHDVAQILNSEGVAIRSGFHCAMPLHLKLKIPGSCRASFYFYNSLTDVDELVSGLKKAIRLFN